MSQPHSQPSQTVPQSAQPTTPFAASLSGVRTVALSLLVDRALAA